MADLAAGTEQVEAPAVTKAVARAGSAAGRHRGRLSVVLALTGTYMLVEAVGGWLTGSLALVADAAHMLTDVFGLGLALFAIWMGSRPASLTRTYGYYRTEILASVANAAVLFGISGFILVEAWRRFQQPPEIQSLPMLGVAVVGLAVNIVGIALLRGGAGESLNVEGAFLEVVSDLLGSLGVIAAALIIYFTDWWYADPLFSVAIGLFIIPRTWKLLRQGIGILLEGTPAGLDLNEVRAAMLMVPGVVAVHDLHVWAVTSGYVVLSAHVVLNAHVQANGDSPATGHNALLRTLDGVLKERCGIAHTTIQLEEEGLEEAERHA